MAFREKMAWTTLISTLLVWGWYFALLVRGMQSGGELFGDLAWRFGVAVVLLVVIQIAAAIAIAVVNPRDADAPADDRERGFALLGYRNAYVALYLQVVVTMLAAPLIVHIGPTLLRGDPADVAAILIGNAILFALLVAEVVQSATQIFLFRRGA